METPLQKRWREFWEIVDMARDDRTRFYTMLHEMKEKELANLYYMYEMNVAELKDDVFIEQMRKNESGITDISEDTVDDAAMWILAHGEDYFLDILEHPEKIPPSIILDSEKVIFDARGAIIQVFEERFNEPIFIKHKEFKWDE